MATPASINKHPIHHMLIVLPLGLWVFSFACQVIALFDPDPVWLVVARFAAAGGVLGALLAAVPGFIDLLSLQNTRAFRTAIIHMTLNLLAVVAWAVVFGLLWRESPRAGAALVVSIIGVILIAISGWLGGEMVYRYGVGVEPTPAEQLKQAAR